MDLKDKAINRIKNNELSTADIMCAFDIIGRDYLNGETSFVNHSDGVYDLIEQFELAPNEIIEYLLDNEYYHSEDLFISFDGETLCSFRDLSYFETMIIKKINGECAEFIMGV